MINELHQLSVALSGAGIVMDSWYREYKPIPKITEKTPCIRIVLSDGDLVRLESVNAEMGMVVRKYGNNQGTFPAMNLAALYRVTDDLVKRDIDKLTKNRGRGINLDTIKEWCVESNWSVKFKKKYRNCMESTPKKILDIMGARPYEPAVRLIKSIEPFRMPDLLYKALERKAFDMIEKRKDIALALQVLFYVGNEKKVQKMTSGVYQLFLMRRV